MRHWLFILTLFLIPPSLSGQYTAAVRFGAGVPNYLPSIAKRESTLYQDNTDKTSYDFKNASWYRQGTIIRDAIPYDSVYTVSGVTITINYTDCRLYNTTTKSFWTWTGTAWRNERVIVVDSLLAMNNIWTGTNTWLKKGTFKDSLETQQIKANGLIEAKKGINSDSTITAKGMNTEGSATKAAIMLKGVQSEKDTIVSTNFTLDGRYGTVGFDCATGEKSAICPPESDTKEWFFIVRKEAEDGNDLIIKNSNGVEFYRLKNKMFCVIKNKNGVWKRER